MNKTLLSLLFVSLFQVAAFAQQVRLGEALHRWMAEASEDEVIVVSLSFDAQVPMGALLEDFESRQLSNELRAKTIMRRGMALSAQTALAFAPAFERIQQQPASHLRLIRRYWLVNMLELEVNAAALRALQQEDLAASCERSDVILIHFDPPVSSNEAPESPNGSELGLHAIGAPALWQLGYTGRGRKAMIFDTGIWPQHPALRGRFMGDRGPLSHAWLGYDFPEPRDKSGSHGTHVGGTVLGLDTATNDTIGVAFGAYYIATDPIATSVAGIKPWPVLIGVFEWAINPDGDTSTVSDIPDVINNSWGKVNTGYDSLCSHPMIVNALLGIEAAGIANVFSAGNEGPGPSTTGMPAALVYDSLSFFAVGAVNGNLSSYPIAGFSSRGPTICPADSQLAIKPEVSAPGMNVRSAVGMNGYASYSGTSMASPHVSGAVLLLKEAFPQLSGRQILNALYQTAVDLGDPGEDNVYGRGMISLPAAFNFLSSNHTPVQAASKAYDLAIAGIDSPTAAFLGEADCNPFGGGNFATSYLVRVVNLGDSVVPGFVLRIRMNGNSDSLVVNQSLAPGQHTLVRTRPYSLLQPFSTAKNVLALEVVSPLPDLDLLNNQWYSSFRSRLNYDYGISNEQFDSSGFRIPMVEQWIVNNIDDDQVSWSFEPIPGPNGAQSAAAMKMRGYGPRLGQLDELISPRIENPILLTGANVFAELQFDLAYSNRTGFSDSLFVALQENCSQDFVVIYSTGGDSMRSFTGVDPSDTTHWRRIRMQILQNVLFPRIKFITKNDFGGNLYLTNLNFIFNVGGSVQSEQPQLKVYPNPTGDWLSMELSFGHIVRFELRDLQGRVLHREVMPEGTDRSRLDLSSLPQGIYLLQLQTDKGSIQTKIIKQ